MCDHKVWLHLLKQTVEFSVEFSEQLFNFVPESRRPELMGEVLRAAASKFPSSDPGIHGCPVKLSWTVQGWGAPETMDMKNSNDVGTNLKELSSVAKAVRINFTILEVQCLNSPPAFSGFTDHFIYHHNLNEQFTTYNRMIAKHVKLQGEKLENFEFGEIDFLSMKETFLSLQRISNNWKVHQFRVNALPCVMKDVPAASSLDNGHICKLFVTWQGGVPVRLRALKRVWEISDEMYMNERYTIEQVFLKGGRGEDQETRQTRSRSRRQEQEQEQEAAWQSVIDYFLRVGANTIEM